MKIENIIIGTLILLGAFFLGMILTIYFEILIN